MNNRFFATAKYYLRQYIGWPVCVFLILIADTASAQPILLNDAIKTAMADISIDAIRQHLSVLAHDSLEGRGTGTQGGRKAARYIAEKLARYGLLPLGKNRSFFQAIPLHGAIPLPESRLALHAADTSFSLNLWEDYILYNTGAQTFSPTPIPMVFVGYGIFAPEYEYNDYYEIDVENRIVVFFSGEPLSEDIAWFEGKKPSVYSDPVMKHRIALSRGARGSIMIPLPRERSYMDWAYWRDQFVFEDIRLPYNVSDNLNVLLRFDFAHHLFRGAPHRLHELLGFDSTGTMRSFSLGVQATFRGKFKERDFVASNIIAMLKGSDPLLKDSYLLISAHYDHLGIGTPVKGDSIYNGVVDNAIGAAALLEMARVFAEMPKPPGRSIVFLFTTAEEKGLLGSRYYCGHPAVPLHKTIAAINVDGLAILDTFDSINAVGKEFSTLGEHLEKVASEMGYFVDNVPSVFREFEFFHRSDQFSFAQAGIPAILLMEGHEYRNIPSGEGVRRFIRWGRDIYHTPFDDVQQEINFSATLQHTQFIFVYAASLANTFILPQWKAGSRFINARLQSIAEQR